MSTNKKSILSKAPKQRSLKEIHNAYYLRCIKKQLFQKPAASLTKTPTKPPQATSHQAYQTLTSAKSKSPKQFINYAKSTNAVQSHNISNLNDSNDANSLNDYMDQQSKLITNKTIEYNSRANTKRTKPISFTPSSTPVTKRKFRSQSKKDIHNIHNKMNSPGLNNININVNEFNNSKGNVIGRNGNVDDALYNSVKRKAVTARGGKGKVSYKKNFSSNDLTVYSNINEEKDCKMLRHRAAVLRFQVEKILTEKMKLEDTLKRNSEYKEQIKKLISEIQSYNNVASSCKRNCHELTKEIISLQTQIKQYK